MVFARAVVADVVITCETRLRSRCYDAACEVDLTLAFSLLGTIGDEEDGVESTLIILLVCIFRIAPATTPLLY